MWEALQILNSLYALTLVGTLLSMLTLRIVTGSATPQINLIGEYRNAAERATRNCFNARAVALSLESNIARRPRIAQVKDVVSICDPSLLIRPTVEEADQLMRTLAALPKRCSDMRASQLRRNLRKLKQVERESVKLLAKLETANRRCAA
jgi:primosomal replication protein N